MIVFQKSTEPLTVFVHFKAVTVITNQLLSIGNRKLKLKIKIEKSNVRNRIIRTIKKRKIDLKIEK